MSDPNCDENGRRNGRASRLASYRERLAAVERDCKHFGEQIDILHRRIQDHGQRRREDSRDLNRRVAELEKWKERQAAEAEAFGSHGDRLGVLERRASGKDAIDRVIDRGASALAGALLFWVGQWLIGG